MRKLRVGVWVNDEYKPQIGGGFGYYTQIIKAFKIYKFNDAEIVFISNKIDFSFFTEQESYQIKTIKKPVPKLSFEKKIIKKIARVFGKKLFMIDYKILEKHYFDELKCELNQVIDLIYYPTPQVIIPNFPYIYTLWDLGHLSMYAFPEVAMNHTFERRKKEHDYSLNKALMIFCESKAGKKDAIKYLNINADRIKVVPIFPSELVTEQIIAIKPSELRPNSEFIHYPAQYWSHKNHYNLLIAFKEVLKTNSNLKLCFTGADKGNKLYILSIIKQLGLESSVLDLGFVSSEALKWLYLNSLGLVMPTFLGPTNMPLLEAGELGCPVACSDLPGHKEQLGDYAYYFNPILPDSIAQAIESMIIDKRNNVKKIYSNNFNIENALKSIDTSFSELKQIRFCWGSSDEIF